MMQQGFNRHIISVLVEDQFGVLQRVCGVFSRRGFNIESLTVSKTEKDGVSRMTVVSVGDDDSAEQVIKQLNKLVEVIRVSELEQGCIASEVMIAKIHTADFSSRGEIINFTGVFGGKIADTKPKTMTVELAGNAARLDEFLALVKPFGVKELVRTGTVAMSRNT